MDQSLISGLILFLISWREKGSSFSIGLEKVRESEERKRSRAVSERTRKRTRLLGIFVLCGSLRESEENESDE